MFRECLHAVSAQETLVTFIIILTMLIGSISSLELVLSDAKSFTHLECILLQSTDIALHPPVGVNTVSQVANFHSVSTNG